MRAILKSATKRSIELRKKAAMNVNREFNGMKGRWIAAICVFERHSGGVSGCVLVWVAIGRLYACRRVRMHALALHVMSATRQTSIWTVCLLMCRASSQNEAEFIDRNENDSERGGGEASDAVANESGERCDSLRWIDF